MSGLPDAPFLHVTTREEWRAWLAANHGTERAVWVVSWRTQTGRPRLAYEDLIEEALCFGWVDSTTRTLDDERSAIYMARRKKGGTWAASNKARVERLVAAGLMQPAGRAAVEQAKADGSWVLLDSVEALVVPDDLAAALDADGAGRARDAYEGLAPGVRKQILWWVVSAKRPQTRARRIDAVVRAARAEGKPPEALR